MILLLIAPILSVMNSERPHHLEEAAVGLCLHEAHVGIAVTVLQIGNQPADGEHAGAVAVKALVGPLAVILVRLSSALRKLGHGYADAR